MDLVDPELDERRRHSFTSRNRRSEAGLGLGEERGHGPSDSPERKLRHRLSAGSSPLREPEGTQGQMGRGRKKSWKGIFKLKKRKSKAILSESDKNKPEDESPKKPSAKVIITELRPEAYYKTLEITPHMTAFEVIVKLIQKYGKTEEDSDPDQFYLTEVRESHQGSYSKVLDNNHQLYEIQSKWDEGSECCFALCRHRTQREPSQSPIPVESSQQPEEFEHKELSPPGLRAMIVSPSQDSFYGFPAFSQTDDETFQPFLLPTSEVPDELPQPTATPPLQPATTDHSHITSSKLIVSPSEESDNPEAFDFSSPVRSKLKPVRPGLKFSSFSDPNIGTIAEVSAEEYEMHTSNNTSHSEENLSENSRHSDGNNEDESSTKAAAKLTQRQLMQESISRGMQGIMSRVVSETKQNSPMKAAKFHTRSNTMPTSLDFLAGKGTTTNSNSGGGGSGSSGLSPSGPVAGHKRAIQVRPLICSPVVSTEYKRYPNFVFTPGPGRTGGEEESRSQLSGELDSDLESSQHESSLSMEKELEAAVVGPLVLGKVEEEEDGLEEGEEGGSSEGEMQAEDMQPVSCGAGDPSAADKTAVLHRGPVTVEDEAFPRQSTVMTIVVDTNFAQPQSIETSDGEEKPVDQSTDTNLDRPSTGTSMADHESLQGTSDHSRTETDVAMKPSQAVIPSVADTSVTTDPHKASSSSTGTAEADTRIEITATTADRLVADDASPTVIPTEDVDQCHQRTNHNTDSSSSSVSESPDQHRPQKDSAKFKTEMELIKPLSAILRRKFTSDSPKQMMKKSSSLADNLHTERDQDSGTLHNTRLNSNYSPTTLRRCKTDGPIAGARSSVTKLKRPHSFHFSKFQKSPSLSPSSTVDFTKDEFIRKAALKGMVRSRNSTPKVSPRDLQQSFTLPDPKSSANKELVSDLDDLVIQHRTSNEATSEATPPRSISSSGLKDYTPPRKPTVKNRHSYREISARINVERYHRRKGVKSSCGTDTGLLAPRGDLSARSDEGVNDCEYKTGAEERRPGLLRPTSAPVRQVAGNVDFAELLQDEDVELSWTQF